MPKPLDTQRIQDLDLKRKTDKSSDRTELLYSKDEVIGPDGGRWYMYSTLDMWHIQDLDLEDMMMDYYIIQHDPYERIMISSYLLDVHAYSDCYSVYVFNVLFHVNADHLWQPSKRELLLILRDIQELKRWQNRHRTRCNN